MMVAYSKLIYYSCYEIGHTWDADCSVGIVDGLISTLMGSMKIYAVVYMLTALLKRKKISKSMAVNLFQNYIRSVCFLTVNGSSFIAFVCIFRKLFGHTNFISAAFLPAFAASVLAIPVERPNRRNMLALYVANVASASMWNVAVGRKYAKPIQNGDVLIFMVGMAILSYYKSTQQSPMIKSLFKFLTGKTSHKNHVDESMESEILFSSNSNGSNGLGRKCLLLIPDLIKLFLGGFGKGYGISVTVRFISSVRKIFSKPSNLINILLDKNAISAGLFLASFSSIFKIVSWLTLLNGEATKPVNDCLAGFFAGTSMFWFPSPTIALYIFWKGLEVMYNNLSKNGYLPVIPCGIEILYCLSTAYLFQVAMFEPQHMKSSYWKFLVNLTEGRIAEYNRKVLDVYGLNSGLLQKWPTYREIDRLSDDFRRQFAHEF